jgi:type IV secretion system protein VirB10
MTTPDQDGTPKPEKAALETIELRARPQPVTRINRKVVIGGAAVLLFLISCIVLVALKPPTLRVGDRPALQCGPQAHHRCLVQAARHL